MRADGVPPLSLVYPVMVDRRCHPLRGNFHDEFAAAKGGPPSGAGTAGERIYARRAEHDSIKTGTRLPETTSPKTVYARLVPAALRAAAPRQPARALQAWWTSPAWRTTKLVLDAVMILGVVWAVAWAATNGIFVAQRAYANRTIVQVHLANNPVTLHALNGARMTPKVQYLGVRHGPQTVHVDIGISNEGPDGVVLRSATLSGPYLAASTVLTHSGSGYIATRSIAPVSGIVTVDCDAAAGVAGALVAMSPAAQQAPTVLTLTVADADGASHRETMTLDTTAMALQGQVCVS
jgi:hypothetical protein